jgi:hypothetical protein
MVRWGQGSLEYRDAAYEDFCSQCSKYIIMLPYMETYVWVHEDSKIEKDHLALSSMEEYEEQSESDNVEIGGEG